MSAFSSSSSGRSKPPLSRDNVNMDDNKNDNNIVEIHNVLPTDDDEINREHLAVHNRTKAMGGVVYSSFSGPTPTAMSLVDTLVSPAGHLSMLDNNKGDVGTTLDVEKKHIKPNVLDLCIPNSEIEKSLVKKLRIPPRPYVVLPCHFVTTYEPDEVIISLKNLFDSGSVINYEYVDQDISVDYEYVEHECGFNGLYVRGSKYCDFKVRIYQEKSGLLIELQRLHKDSCGFTFKKLFQAMKSKLTSPMPSPNTVTSSPIFNNSDATNEFVNADIDFSSVDMSTTSQLTDEEINTSIKQVLAMMQESNDQSQLESCRILCDLSEENEIRKQMIDNGCIPALISTLSNDKPLLQQHSVFALAQLSECHDSAEALVACRAIPLLMSFITNGTYKTAAMRRECARVIANTAMKNASIVRESVSDEDFNAWAQRIPSLEDATVKERSERAFSFINNAV